MKVLAPSVSVLAVVVGCSSTPPPAPTVAPPEAAASDASSAPAAPTPSESAPVPTAVASAASAKEPPSSAPGSSAALRRSGKTPAWTLNGTDPATGMVVVRCENGTPPDDHSGKCSCEGYDLDVCPDGVAQLRISNKQCGFKCKARAEKPPTIAVRCADTTKPTVTQFGCVCGNQKPIDPCVGGLAGSKLEGDMCTITCRKPQP